MAFSLVPLAVPFWRAATYRSIIGCLATGRIVDGPHLEQLRAVLIQRLGAIEARLCGSGSLALEIALRACGVGAGDHVVVPSFCCSAIVAPIVALGAVPVLADVGPELNLTAACVDAVLDKHTKAIVVPHLFGNPAPVDPIIELAKPKGVCVIDDAAQALGATIGGRPVGALGDYGIVSFGSEKICSGFGGGALLAAERHRAAAMHEGTLAESSGREALRSCLSTLFWRRWRRWTRPLEQALARSAPADPHAPPQPYRREAMANLNAAVALSLARSLPENIMARRARMKMYRELLGGDERLRLIEHQPGSACLSQVVQVTRRRRGTDLASRIIANLSRAGFEIQGSYVPIHLLRGTERCVWHRLPHTDRIWPDLIELPCEPTVRPEHVARIAAIVQQSLGE